MRPNNRETPGSDQEYYGEYLNWHDWLRLSPLAQRATLTDDTRDFGDDTDTDDVSNWRESD